LLIKPVTCIPEILEINVAYLISFNILTTETFTENCNLKKKKKRMYNITAKQIE